MLKAGYQKSKRSSTVCIALHRNPSQSYGASPDIWHHTVLPATWHSWKHLALTPAVPAAMQYSIYLPRRDKKWELILVVGYTYPDGLPVCRQSPIQAVSNSVQTRATLFTETHIQALHWVKLICFYQWPPLEIQPWHKPKSKSKHSAATSRTKYNQRQE